MKQMIKHILYQKIKEEYTEVSNEEDENIIKAGDMKEDVTKNLKVSGCDQSYEIIPGQRENSATISPGILLVKNKFKFFCKAEWQGKYTYQCARGRKRTRASRTT